MRRGVGVCLCLGFVLAGGHFAAGQGGKGKKAGEPVYRGKALGEWIKALKGKDLLPRVEALNVLVQAGPEARAAVPALIGVFRDSDATFLHPLAAVALARVGPGALPELKKGLKDKTALVRSGSALALSLMGPRAKDASGALAEALGDREAIVRQAAASALGQIGPGAKGAAPALRKALRDREPGVRVEAADALWRVEKDAKSAVPALVRVLGEGRPEAAERAAGVLGEIGKPARDALPELKKALGAKDARVRVGAAEACWKVGRDAKSALPVLGSALKDGDADVRRAAARALGTMAGEPPAGKLLAEALGDAEARVRREGACAFTESGAVSGATVAALRRGLSDPDAGVRWWCASALLGSEVNIRAMEEEVLCALWGGSAPGWQGEPPAKGLVLDVRASASGRAVPALVRALESRPARWKAEAARALGFLGGDARAAVPALVRALGSDDKWVRRAAAETLGGVGPEVVPQLTRLLGNANARVREGAARALGQVGFAARPAVGGLKKLLKDPESTVRTQSALALWTVDQDTLDSLATLKLVLTDVDNRDRWEVIEAFGIVGVEARPPVKGLLEVLYKALKDRDARVRVQAVKWLWRRTGEARIVVPLLRDVVGERDAFVRLVALETLGELGPEARVLSLVAGALDDRDPAVRCAALEGLVRAGAGGVTQAAEGLKHRSARVRARVALALGRIGPPAGKAKEALLDALDDSDPSVRRAAGSALRAIFPKATEETIKGWKAGRKKGGGG
jgi:HEAT repeat protein